MKPYEEHQDHLGTQNMSTRHIWNVAYDTQKKAFGKNHLMAAFFLELYGCTLGKGFTREGQSRSTTVILPIKGNKCMKEEIQLVVLAQKIIVEKKLWKPVGGNRDP